MIASRSLIILAVAFATLVTMLVTVNAQTTMLGCQETCEATMNHHMAIVNSNKGTESTTSYHHSIAMSMIGVCKECFNKALETSQTEENTNRKTKDDSSYDWITTEINRITEEEYQEIKNKKRTHYTFKALQFIFPSDLEKHIKFLGTQRLKGIMTAQKRIDKPDEFAKHLLQLTKRTSDTKTQSLKPKTQPLKPKTHSAPKTKNSAPKTKKTLTDPREMNNEFMKNKKARGTAGYTTIDTGSLEVDEVTGQVADNGSKSIYTELVNKKGQLVNDESKPVRKLEPLDI